MNSTEKLGSGAVVQITIADFKDAMGLVRALRKATMGLPQDENISSAVIVSEEVSQALFNCFSRVLYDGRRVDQALFDDPKDGVRAREDYFDLCNVVIKANCTPFFAHASSMSTEQKKSPA